MSCATRHLTRSIAAVLLVTLTSCSSGDRNDRDAVLETSIEAPSDDSAPTTAVDTADQASTHVGELPNGLGVRITQLAGAESTAILLVFDVGGHHDPAGRSGMAHFAEHLLVTGGTSLEPERTIEDMVAAYPLGWNAQTGTLTTIYATIVDPAAVRDELERVAARLAGVSVSRDAIERERERVLVELDNMYGNIPMLAAGNIAREQVLPTPNNGRRGGTVAAVSDIDLTELREWLEFYNPSTATLAVAGDLDAAAMMAEIDALFGSITPGPPSPAAAGQIDGEAGLVAAVPSSPQSLVSVSFRAPPPGSDSHAAFLVAIRRLFFEGAAHDLTVNHAPLDDPEVATITTTVTPDETAVEAATRVRVVLAELLARPLHSGEREETLQLFGSLFGFVPNSANPYGAALASVRTSQLGLSADKLRADLTDLTESAYQQHINAVFNAQATSGANVGG